MTAMQLIEEYVDKKELCEPIYTKDIYEYVKENIPSITPLMINTYISRYEKKNELFIRFKKGIYYKSADTPFGKPRIKENLLIDDKYIIDGSERVGFVSGPSLLNNAGVSTQIPRDIHITTNNYRTKIFSDNVILKKPIVEINEANYQYLITLDLINEKDHSELSDDDFKTFICEYINGLNLSYEGLIYYANKYKDKKLLNYIVSLAGEIYSEITFK